MFMLLFVGMLRRSRHSHELSSLFNEVYICIGFCSYGSRPFSAYRFVSSFSSIFSPALWIFTFRLAFSLLSRARVGMLASCSHYSCHWNTTHTRSYSRPLVLTCK
jgi:hypothetical protein